MASNRISKALKPTLNGTAGQTAPSAVIPALDGEGPIWQQIRRALANPILNGQWPPGTRIPTEALLTQRFGISRMTASKAVQQLVADGLVQRRRKVGTLVAERALERPVFEIWDIADLVARHGGVYAYRLLECRKLGPDAERRELLGVSVRTPLLWMRCMHSSDGKPIQLEERLINIDAAPNITCQPLETQGPSSWLLSTSLGRTRSTRSPRARRRPTWRPNSRSNPALPVWWSTAGPGTTARP